MMPRRDFLLLTPSRDFYFWIKKNEPEPNRDSSQTSPRREETFTKHNHGHMIQKRPYQLLLSKPDNNNNNHILINQHTPHFNTPTDVACMGESMQFKELFDHLEFYIKDKDFRFTTVLIIV